MTALMRALSICVLTAVACLAIEGTALAQDTGALPNGAVLAWPRMFVPNNGDPNDLVEPPSPEDLRKRLNLGACLCSQAGSTTDTDLYYELTMSPTTGMNL